MPKRGAPILGPRIRFERFGVRGARVNRAQRPTVRTMLNVMPHSSRVEFWVQGSEVTVLRVELLLAMPDHKKVPGCC